jgi:hypothetical protein
MAPARLLAVSLALLFLPRAAAEPGLNAPVTFSNTFNIAINPNGNANPYPSTINVQGLVGTIRTISIRLNGFSHTRPDDVDAVLVGPGGQALIFMSDVGFPDAVSGITLTFSDRGLAPPSAPLTTGTYLPYNLGVNDNFPFPGPGLVYSNPPPNGAATFSSTFRGAQANGLWRLFIVDDSNFDAGSVAGGWSLTFTTSEGPADFDGDGKSDWAVTRAGSLVWHILNTAGYTGVSWGDSGDIRVPGDYDGDGISDIAIWRPSTGTFWVRRSSDLGTMALNWGQNGDDPRVVGDYDGDLRTDFAVYRPGNPSVWWVRRSSNGATLGMAFGQTGDKPAPGDYDGDGKADFAIVRGPGAATFYIQQSTAGFTAVPWGLLSDSILSGDFDGDGKTDVGIARAVAGSWDHYIRRSSDGSLYGQTWGLSTDVLTPGDYDGDGRSDLGVWRGADATFYVLKSTNGALLAQPWGLAGDYPVLFSFVH